MTVLCPWFRFYWIVTHFYRNLGWINSVNNSLCNQKIFMPCCELFSIYCVFKKIVDLYQYYISITLWNNQIDYFIIIIILYCRKIVLLYRLIANKQWFERYDNSVLYLIFFHITWLLYFKLMKNFSFYFFYQFLYQQWSLAAIIW